MKTPTMNSENKCLGGSDMLLLFIVIIICLGRLNCGVWNGGGWIRQISGPEFWNFGA